MCGRFTLRTPSSKLVTQFVLGSDPDSILGGNPASMLRYILAPTHRVLGLRLGSDDKREPVSFRWGLLPFWSKDGKVTGKHINARAETVHQLPVFREPFKTKRCLILADGFYEWRGWDKQPFYFHLANDEPFAFAGLWDKWSKGGDSISTCAIITTTANDTVRPVHDRMPVVLSPEHYDLWLDPGVGEPERLLPLLQSNPDLVADKVATLVNSPKNDVPECITPLVEHMTPIEPHSIPPRR